MPPIRNSASQKKWCSQITAAKDELEVILVKSIVICVRALWPRVPIRCQTSGKYTDRSAGILLLNSSRLLGFLEVRGAEVWLLQPYADPQPLN